MVRGFSMTPCIRDEDVLTIVPMNGRCPAWERLLLSLCPTRGAWPYIASLPAGSGWLMRGDNAFVRWHHCPEHIIGRVTRVTRRGRAVRFGLGAEGAWIAALTSGEY